jgi:hypothetical protein
MRFVLLLTALLAPAALRAQAARPFDILTYSAPPGFNEVRKPDGGGRVELTRTGRGTYCLIGIYASTPASANLEASFAAEWQGVMLKTISPVAAPRPVIRTAGNTSAAFGRAVSTAGGQPALGALFVLDAGARVLTIMVVTPSVAVYNEYAADIEGLLASIAIRRESPAPVSGGKLNVPPPPPNITVADLAGDWGRNDGITTTYVDRYSGAYAGTDSLHFTEKWTLTREGGISLDFFGIRNGKKIVEKSSGTVALSGGVLVIQMTNRQRYVFRGWLDLPEMTIMKLNGPWYDDPIPANIFTNPAQGANLDKNWIRKK